MNVISRSGVNMQHLFLHAIHSSFEVLQVAKQPPRVGSRLLHR